ncbi:amino acid carrier protein [Bacteriovoracaceae bacterium]|nr:amino acid carrier protein [Bacteriovoracaceae bacterium]
MSEILSTIANYAWGTPLIIWLFIANFYLLYVSKLIPLKGFSHAFSILRKRKSDSDLLNNEHGSLSPFQALCNALSATIGLGNIGGVAVAIYHGGAGAVFWMWVTAFLGMNTKFFEVALSVIYRGKNHHGEVVGGPMYVIENQFPKQFQFLGWFFALCGIIGTLSLFQINQLTEFAHDNIGVNKNYFGIGAALVIGVILFGGIKRITKVTSKLVPIMSLSYLTLTLLILLMNLGKLPELFLSIFQQAFNPTAAAGGVGGYVLMKVIQTGVKRATFSNEAGLGTEPMAHSDVQTKEPISEGYVSILGPFFDTIIICSLTALVILLYFDPSQNNLNGVLLATNAYRQALGQFGVVAIGIIITLFSFSTMIGMANYNKKCWDFIFRGRFFMGDKAFLLYYLFTIWFGATNSLDDVVNLIDSAYAFMAIPNVIVLLVLAGRVKEKLTVYNNTYLK